MSGFGPLPLPVTREVLAGLFATAFSAERVEQDTVKQGPRSVTTRVWAANAFAFHNPEWESELEQISTPLKAAFSLPQARFHAAKEPT